MVRGLRVERREGLLIVLKSDRSSAFGEIAPLPGLHDESLDEAGKALAEFIPELPGLCRQTPGTRQRMLEEAQLPPSVATGIEMALFNLDASETGSFPSFPGTFPAAHMVPVNALLSGTPETVMNRARQRYAEGFRTFKLKVVRDRIDEAAATIRAFHDAFGGRAGLRLDANQSLGLDEAVEFGSAVPAGSVSYIEEPLTDASMIPDFHDRTALRSALDETLWQRPELLDEIPASALGGLILKPNRIGGIMKSLDLALEAYRRSLPAVLSSAFESGVSLGMYALMGAVCSPEPPACGLDTISFLDHDLTGHPFASPEGKVDPAAAWRNSLRVRRELLEPVESWTW